WLGISASLTDMSLGQRVLQGVVRTLLLAVLVLSLGQPALQGKRQTVSQVVLLDVSDSMTDRQLAAGAALVGQLQQLSQQRGDELHLVTFAARPRVVPPPPPGSPLPPLRQTGEAGTDGTDIQAALQLGYGLFPPATIRRVLVLSDGNETEGDLLGEAQAARRRGVRI